jgi:hypothetical protein
MYESTQQNAALVEQAAAAARALEEQAEALADAVSTFRLAPEAAASRSSGARPVFAGAVPGADARPAATAEEAAETQDDDADATAADVPATPDDADLA